MSDVVNAKLNRILAAIAVTALFLTETAWADLSNAASASLLVTVAGQSINCNSSFMTNPQPILPKGFAEQIIYSGCLNQPTAMSFNGKKNRVFIAEKGGKVWNCDLSTPTCTLFADLSSKVCNKGDRGLLGLAVDPRNDGKIYVLYTILPATGDCSGDIETYGQLSLLTASGETKILPAAGSATQTWCFNYTSHNIGDLEFGKDDKTLYVSAGDGASFTQVDYGQLKTTCGDGLFSIGGAFRSQGVTSYSNGAILRIAAPGTPNQSTKIVAKGFRNPFRFARRPGTNDLFVGDVGWRSWESIKHISAIGQNFGWPCYEGWNPGNRNSPAAQADYQNTGYCSGIGSVTAPFYSYNHQSYITTEDSVGAETCGGPVSGGGPDQNGSVISAIGFTDNTSRTYPAQFKNALYFGDTLRRCIWTMRPPNKTPKLFAKGLQGGPVDLKTGPRGDIYYVDLITGTVRRIFVPVISWLQWLKPSVYQE